MAIFFSLGLESHLSIVDLEAPFESSNKKVQGNLKIWHKLAVYLRAKLFVLLVHVRALDIRITIHLEIRKVW